MRKLLPAVGILLALLCAWLILDQPGTDSINADEAAAVQEDVAPELAPKIATSDLVSSEAGASTQAIDAGNAAAEREAIAAMPDGMAEIGVKVMLATTSQSVGSMEVRAQRVAAEGGFGSTFGDPIEPIESVRTGPGGEAVLRVPAGVALVISAGGPGKLSILMSPGGEMAKLEYEESSQEVAALSPGEKVNITLRMTAASDLHWFQLVDAATGALLPGARVIEPPNAKLESDENGIVSVPQSNDYYGRQVAIFSMQDYGPRRVDLEKGGATAEQAHRVELFPAASLRLTVLQNGLPVPGMRMAMHYARSDGEIESPNRARWGGKPRMAPFWGDTNEQGVLVFENLPAHQPLMYGTSTSFGTNIAQAAPGPITLQPGEQREITWEIGQRKNLHGRVIDADGSPVVAAEVLLLNAQFQHGLDLEQANVPEWVNQYRLAGVSTDENGEFEFVEIHPGEYWLALAPSDDPNLVATARRVSVPALQEPPYVELQYSSGAMVRGSCVDLTGEPLADIDLIAMGSEGRASFQASSAVDGSFEVGPFSAGSEVQFFVLHSLGGYQISEPVTALAGDGQAVVLRMVKGGTIRGRTVNAKDGKPIEIGVTISSIEAGGATGSKSGPGGNFNFGGLAPGTWRVIAKNQSGWVGVSQPIVMTAADVVEDVEVKVSPGGTLVVESVGEASGTLRVSFEAWTVDFITIGPGERKSLTVPFGLIQISSLDGGPKPRAIGEVTVEPGQVETFQFKSDA